MERHNRRIAYTFSSHIGNFDVYEEPGAWWMNPEKVGALVILTRKQFFFAEVREMLHVSEDEFEDFLASHPKFYRFVELGNAELSILLSNYVFSYTLTKKDAYFALRLLSIFEPAQFGRSRKAREQARKNQADRIKAWARLTGEDPNSRLFDNELEEFMTGPIVHSKWLQERIAEETAPKTLEIRASDGVSIGENLELIQIASGG